MHTAMKNPIDILKRAKHFITEDIWKLDIEDFSRAKARSIKYLKVLIITIKTFSTERIGNQAVCLSFFGTMAVVPFIAVTFAITDGFGLRGHLQDMIYEYFDTSEEVIDQVICYADNIINAAQSNAVGLISALLFVWLIFWMMLNVESAFNHVWRVKKSRNFFRRLAAYCTILMIAPFVVLIMFSAIFMYANAFDSIGFGAEVTDTLKSARWYTSAGTFSAPTTMSMSSSRGILGSASSTLCPYMVRWTTFPGKSLISCFQETPVFMV